MAKNPIQEQRMKKYFIDATKEILIGEGFHALSVRNVAEKAGYSYATLYNYFKGLPELISCCISDFQNDCNDFIQSKTGKMKSGKNKLKCITIAYVDYLIQYPSLFKLFYIEKLSSIRVNHTSILFLDQLLLEALRTDSKSISINVIPIIKHLMAGMLLHYMHRSYPENYKAFKEQVEKNLDAILKIA